MSLRGAFWGVLLSVSVACSEAERAPVGTEVDNDPSLVGDAGLDASAGDAALADTGALADADLDGGLLDGDGASSGDDARAEEWSSQAHERLLVVDARDPAVHAYDLEEARVLETFALSAPARIFAGPTARYAYLAEDGRDQLVGVDMGLTEVASPEGDGYVLAPVRLLAAGPSGAQASSLYAHAGTAVAFFAGSARAHVFDEASLLGSWVETVIDAGEPHAGIAAPWTGKVFASTRLAGGESQLRRFSAAGQSEALLDCPSPTSAALNDSALAIGCRGGVLRFAPGQTEATRAQMPDGSSAPFQKLVSHPDQPAFLGSTGDKLCVLWSTLHCVPAPEGILDFAFDAPGKRALVLGRDGRLRSLEMRTLVEQGSFAVTSPAGADTEARALPHLAVGRRFAYVSDPALGVVHVVHAATQTLVDELTIGGAPAQVLVFRYRE